MKKRILLLLTSLTTLTSCGFFTNTEEEKTTTPTNENPGESTTPTTEGPKETEEPKDLEVEETELDSVYIDEMGIEDTTKNEFTVKWQNGNTTLLTQNNVVKGTYPQINEANKVPTKISTDQNYVYTFKGWSRNPNSTTCLEEKDLFPIVSDTTFYSIFEKTKAYEVDVYYVKDVGSDLYNKEKYTYVGKQNIPEGEIFDVESFTPAPSANKKIDETITVFELNDDLKWFDDEGEYIGRYLLDEFKQQGGIKKNAKYLVVFSESDIYYEVKFMNEGVLYNGYSVLPVGKTMREVYYDPYVKDKGKPAPMSIFNQPNPVKMADGKKYEFLGWRKEGDTTSTPLSALDLPACTGEDVVYNAVFSTQSTPVFVVLLSNDGKLDALTLDQAINESYYKIENNVLKPFIVEGRFGYLKSYKDIKFSIYDSRIKSIASDAFSTLSVSSIQFGSNISSLPSNVLRDQSSLTDVKISSSLTTIPSGAFDGCSSLSKFDGFNYIKNFGENSFKNCSNLNVTFGSQISKIDISAFENAKIQEELTLNVATVSNSAFHSVKGLKKLTLSNTTTVNKHAFSYSQSLEEINLPKTLNSLDSVIGKDNRITSKPFESCSNLNKITIDSANTTYSSLNSNGVFTKDGKTLIQGSNSVIIPNSVTKIEDDSLTGLTFERINIPKSVTLIESGAFNDNINLTVIDYQGTREQFKKVCQNGLEYVFYNKIKNNITVRCTDGEILLELK